MSSNIILLTQRVVIDEKTKERRDALDQQWSNFVTAFGCTPVPIPNHIKDVERYIAATEPSGIILTGGNDLGSYGGDAPERDKLELKLLQIAQASKIPLMGVCRGMQLIQHSAGTKLHRVEGHAGTQIKCSLSGKSVWKNSYHDWGTSETSSGYQVISTSEDGLIKAIQSKSEPINAIMWHPERNSPFDPDDLKVFRDFFRHGQHENLYE